MKVNWSQLPDILVTTHVNLLELAVVSRSQVLAHFNGDVLGQDRQQQLLLANKENVNEQQQVGEFFSSFLSIYSVRFRFWKFSRVVIVCCFSSSIDWCWFGGSWIRKKVELLVGFEPTGLCATCSQTRAILPVNCVVDNAFGSNRPIFC